MKKRVKFLLDEQLSPRLIAANHQHWGLCLIRPETPFAIIISSIHLVWELSDAREWINKVEWIPF